MKSSISIRRNAAVVVSEILVQRLEEIAFDFSRSANAVDIITKDQEIPKWDVDYIDNQKLLGISAPEFLALPNAGPSTVKSIALNVGFLTPTLKVSIGDRFGGPAYIDIKADDINVRDYATRLNNALESSKPAWNFMRNPYLDWAIYLSIIVIFMWFLLSYLESKINESMSNYWFLLPVVGLPLGSGLIARRAR